MRGNSPAETSVKKGRVPKSNLLAEGVQRLWESVRHIGTIGTIGDQNSAP